MEVLRRPGFGGLKPEVVEGFNRYPTDKELATQSKSLCRDFILSRLQKAGLVWSKADLTLPTSTGKLCEVSAVLLCLGDELESMRPSVYRNVARQLNISVAMETMVSDAFVAVATDIFSAGITWGKVVSLYAVAGALAVDCVRQGQPATVYTIVHTLGQFVRRFLAPWMKKRGGWADITKCVVKTDPAPEPHWLASSTESLKYCLTTLYIYIMKEQC